MIIGGRKRHIYEPKIQNIPIGLYETLFIFNISYNIDLQYFIKQVYSHILRGPLHASCVFYIQKKK